MIDVFWDIWVGLCSWLFMRYSRSRAHLRRRRTRRPFCRRHTCGLMGAVDAYQFVDWHMLFVCLFTAPQSATSRPISVGCVAIVCRTDRKLICTPRSCAVEAKRGLIAHDKPTPVPKGGGFISFSPVNRPRACMVFIQYRRRTSQSPPVTMLPRRLSITCKVFLHASSDWAVPNLLLAKD